MNHGVAIDAAAIERPDVQRFAGGGRMAGQHMNVALLAQQMIARCQQLGIARTMWRVATQAILADRRVVPEKGPPFFGMAGVTQTIGGMIVEHLPPLSAMSIVAGSATDFHVVSFGAKQVGGALIKVCPPVAVAGKASFFLGAARQHFGLWLAVVGAVTRQAAHVIAIMRAAAPAQMGAITSVALQTRFVDLRHLHVGRIGDVFGFERLDVFGAVAVAAFARRRARTPQELAALAVRIERIRVYGFFVALYALRADDDGLNHLRGGFRLCRSLG